MGRPHLGKIRLHVKLDPDLARQTDAAAKEKKMDRSAFISEAIKEKFKRESR